jgi:CheY-like chemotaxis protein
VVEDVEINFEIIAAMLENTQMQIESAVNGAEALSLFEKNPTKYDIIFMDIHMPIMDGYHATESIRALPHPAARTVPIIAMTANVFKEDVEKSIKCGMNAHIGKPINIKIVREILRKYL